MDKQITADEVRQLHQEQMREPETRTIADVESLLFNGELTVNRIKLALALARNVGYLEANEERLKGLREIESTFKGDSVQGGAA